MKCNYNVLKTMKEKGIPIVIVSLGHFLYSAVLLLVTFCRWTKTRGIVYSMVSALALGFAIISLIVFGRYYTPYPILANVANILAIVWCNLTLYAAFAVPKFAPHVLAVVPVRALAEADAATPAEP